MNTTLLRLILKIIDIILSGYGSLNVDSETLFVKFVFEQNYKN